MRGSGASPSTAPAASAPRSPTRRRERIVAARQLVEHPRRRAETGYQDELDGLASGDRGFEGRVERREVVAILRGLERRPERADRDARDSRIAQQRIEVAAASYSSRLGNDGVDSARAANRARVVLRRRRLGAAILRLRRRPGRAGRVGSAGQQLNLSSDRAVRYCRALPRRTQW